MKKIIILLFILVKVSLFSNDGAYKSGKAGSLIPFKNTNIIMDSEYITIDVFQLGEQSLGLEYNCEFNIKNMSNEPQNLIIGFPIHYGNQIDMFGQRIGHNDVKDFKVLINNENVEYEWYMQGINKDIPEIISYDEVYGFEVSFKPNESKKIVNTYSMRPFRGVIDYIVLSALTWNSPVNSADFEINFHFPVKNIKNAESFTKTIDDNQHMTLVNQIKDFVPIEDIRVIVTPQYNNYFRDLEININDINKYIIDFEENSYYPNILIEILNNYELNQDQYPDIYKVINTHFNKLYEQKRLSYIIAQQLNSDIKYLKRNELLNLDFNIDDYINNYKEKNKKYKLKKLEMISHTLRESSYDDDLYNLVIKAFAIYYTFNSEQQTLNILEKFYSTGSNYISAYILQNYINTELNGNQIIKNIMNDFTKNLPIVPLGSIIVKILNQLLNSGLDEYKADKILTFIDVLFKQNDANNWLVYQTFNSKKLNSKQLESLRYIIYELANYYYDSDLLYSERLYKIALEQINTESEKLVKMHFIAYNLCCVYSNLEKYDLALNYLKIALENGYSNYDWLYKDPDIKKLRDITQYNFEKLIKEYKN